MDEFEKSLKIEFLAEAKQAIEDVEQCFLELESDPNDLKNLDKIFRLAHNLKGSSRAVGFHELGAFTHEFESFIIRFKIKELDPSAQVIDTLLRAADHVKKMIEGLSINQDATFNSETLINEMTRVPVRLEQLKDEVTTHFDLKTPVLPLAEPALIKQVPSEIPLKIQNTSNMEESLRVSLHKVENLINAVGEMVILNSGLQEQAMSLGSPALKKIVQQLAKVSKEIQESSMSLRMVPIKPLFQKMQRIVRDTSQSLKKDVGIQVLGEETDVDKTVLEKISDPLVHLVRNAVDHGIEKGEVRTSCGKPEKGQIKIRATHQSGKMIIEVIDDGGGLDPEKLRVKAIEKGIISSDQILTISEAQQLIFAPGFSTKEQVSEISGRGVGMDVVKTNIQEIGGEIQIQSQIGAGSTFKIILPLTLAIVDAMILKNGDQRYVIPINQVYETLCPESHQIRMSSFGTLLVLREEHLPLYRLGDFFGIKNSTPEINSIAIIIRSGDVPFAFLVDDIIGQTQVVIKQLGKELSGLRGISGSTILSDGRPALIIEARDLLLKSSYKHNSTTSSFI